MYLKRFNNLYEKINKKSRINDKISRIYSGEILLDQSQNKDNTESFLFSPLGSAGIQRRHRACLSDSYKIDKYVDQSELDRASHLKRAFYCISPLSEVQEKEYQMDTKGTMDMTDHLSNQYEFDKTSVLTSDGILDFEKYQFYY